MFGWEQGLQGFGSAGLRAFFIHIMNDFYHWSYTYVNTCKYYIVINKYEHTYIHTYLPTYIHTYLPTYIHTYIPTYLHTYIPTYLHTYIHTYLPTYIHTYLPTYIHTYMHVGPWWPMWRGGFSPPGEDTASYNYILGAADSGLHRRFPRADQPGPSRGDQDHPRSLPQPFPRIQTCQRCSNLSKYNEYICWAKHVWTDLG